MAAHPATVVPKTTLYHVINEYIQKFHQEIKLRKKATSDINIHNLPSKQKLFCGIF